MPYLFTCPHCQTATQVEDRYSGQAGRCVTCGEAIQLPEFPSGVTESARPTKSRRSVGWIAAAIVSVILLACLLFAILRVGGQTMTRLASSRERSTSIRNLERIAGALKMYASDHGTYPPNVTRDENNKVLHSWRVLILPYIGEEDLYDRFDLTLPWDDPVNMQLAYELPSVFIHPGGNSASRFAESAYYLVVGPGTLFPSGGPLAPSQITDDLKQTILVTEGTPLVPAGLWTEPIDIDFTRMRGRLGGNAGFELGGLIEGGAAFATADGLGHFLPNTTEPTTVRALVTPQGGERLPDDTLD